MVCKKHLTGCSDLYLHMGKTNTMYFALVKQRQFYFFFPAVTKLVSKHSFAVVQQLMFCGQANYIIPPYGIQLQKHFVIIISMLYDESNRIGSCV